MKAIYKIHMVYSGYYFQYVPLREVQRSIVSCRKITSYAMAMTLKKSLNETKDMKLRYHM